MKTAQKTKTMRRTGTMPAEPLREVEPEIQQAGVMELLWAMVPEPLRVERTAAPTSQQAEAGRRACLHMAKGRQHPPGLAQTVQG